MDLKLVVGDKRTVAMVYQQPPEASIIPLSSFTKKRKCGVEECMKIAQVCCDYVCGVWLWAGVGGGLVS